MNVNVTQDWAVYVFSALLSLVLSYAPTLSTKFAALPKATKQLIAAGGVLTILAIMFTLTCTNALSTNLTCTTQGAMNMLVTYVIALGVNQGVFGVSPQTDVVLLAKVRTKLGAIPPVIPETIA